MAVAYAEHVSTRKTPQSEAIPGKPMVENSAGGFSFEVDCWARLDRFLILGNEGGSYYASERKMTQENAQSVRDCHGRDPVRTVDRIVEISESGRAPKNDPAIFALAMLSKDKRALNVLSRVCRIGTHLFQFMGAVKHFRGRGRALSTALKKWYLEKQPRDLAYQVTKYQSREGWSHRDVLRLCKPKTDDRHLNYALRYVTKGELGEVTTEGSIKNDPWNSRDLLQAVQEIKGTDSEKRAIELIEEHKLVREVIPTHFLNSPAIWEALLGHMPLTAMVRNLGKMSSVGLLTPMSDACRLVASRLVDQERIHKSRIHPIALLVAQGIYSQGRGLKGSLTWNADSGIMDALNESFYLAFGNVPSTNKRWLLGLDVSGSMECGYIAGTCLTPRVASAAMAMLTVRTEPMTHTMGFSHTLVDIPLSKTQRLDDVIRAVSSVPMGGTNCALPMLYAMGHKIPVDVFCVYTDSETWHGTIHPCQALVQYRQKMGIPAKLIVVGMVSNKFSIADPEDGGMLDVVGFDTSAPQVMSDFAISV